MNERIIISNGLLQWHRQWHHKFNWLYWITIVVVAFSPKRKEKQGRLCVPIEPLCNGNIRLHSSSFNCYLCDAARAHREIRFQFPHYNHFNFWEFQIKFPDQSPLLAQFDFHFGTFCASYFCWCKAMVISIGLQANVCWSAAWVRNCQTMVFFLLYKYGSMMVINNARQSLVIFSTSAHTHTQQKVAESQSG